MKRGAKDEIELWCLRLQNSSQDLERKAAEHGERKGADGRSWSAAGAIAAEFEATQQPIARRIKAASPTDAAAENGGPKGRAQDRSRHHKRVGLRHVRLSGPAAPRVQPSTAGIRRSANRRLSLG